MKLYKLTSLILSAAICAFSLGGCAKTPEAPLDVGVSSAGMGFSAAESSDTSSKSASSVGSAGEASSSAAALSSEPETSSSVPEQSPAQSAPQSSSEVISSSAVHTHTYVSKTVAPTCVEAGYTVYTCSCGDSYIGDTVGVLDHDCAENVIAPTCTVNGYTQHTCRLCGYRYADNYTNALGHKYSSRVVEPTCTQNGYTIYTCERCGSEYRGDEKPGYGHDWGEWTVTKEPTTSSEGVRQRKCSRCGETSTQTVPRLEVDPAKYADEVIRLVNEQRAKNGLSALTKRDDLTEYAQLRSTEIVDNFDHVRPDGSSPLDYVMGLDGVWGAGENIAAGYRSPEEVMNGWMNSSGHRRNILRGDYTSIGVGCYRSGGRLYWVQIFAM